MKKYKKALTRECSLFDVKAWYKGESEELKKLAGIGYFNHLFVCKNGFMTLYYDLEEAEIFDEWFKEKFTEDFFNKVCDNFYELINSIEVVESDEEIFDLSVKMWPALFFFDELSKYPELGNSDMIRRLIRVRKTTETASYKLSKKVIFEDSPEEYIFFKGDIYFKDFDSFCKEQNIEIVK